MTSLLLYIFFISVCILFAKKFKILPNYSGQLHQKFVQQETTPLIGGFFILILFYPVLITNYKIFIGRHSCIIFYNRHLNYIQLIVDKASESTANTVSDFSSLQYIWLSSLICATQNF